jgi:enamine deaminase RidA (YjgF/YER057c/UK114 family)
VVARYLLSARANQAARPLRSQYMKGTDMAKRAAIFPADRHALYDLHQYSAAIRHGDLLFVSGQVGSREDGSPEPVFEDQVRRAFANLREVLAAAGATFDDVIDVITFHTDPQTQFERMLAIRAEEIGEPPFPTWTAVGVTWLSGFDFEIKVIARIPSKATENAQFAQG